MKQKLKAIALGLLLTSTAWSFAAKAVDVGPLEPGETVFVVTEQGGLWQCEGEADGGITCTLIGWLTRQ